MSYMTVLRLGIQLQIKMSVLFIEDNEFLCVYIHHICHYLAHSPAGLKHVYKKVWNKMSGRNFDN